MLPVHPQDCIPEVSPRVTPPDREEQVAPPDSERWYAGTVSVIDASPVRRNTASSEPLQYGSGTKSRKPYSSFLCNVFQGRLLYRICCFLFLDNQDRNKRLILNRILLGRLGVPDDGAAVRLASIRLCRDGGFVLT
jgi:hypothetical protein